MFNCCCLVIEKQADAVVTFLTHCEWKQSRDNTIATQLINTVMVLSKFLQFSLILRMQVGTCNFYKLYISCGSPG